jgi:hypothetical protein
MSKINDGGPAFPRQALQVENREQWDYEELRGQSGMSLRAYFAGQALAGMHASCKNIEWPSSTWLIDAADCAVRSADALIAAMAEVKE